MKNRSIRLKTLTYDSPMQKNPSATLGADSILRLEISIYYFISEGRLSYPLSDDMIILCVG